MIHNECAASTGELLWFKSSYGSGEGGECVEVAGVRSLCSFATRSVRMGNP